MERDRSLRKTLFAELTRAQLLENDFGTESFDVTFTSFV